MNKNTVRMAARMGRVVATLVREAPNGARELVAVIENDRGVRGLAMAAGPVWWPVPGDGAPRRIERLKALGFRWYTDDGAAMRPL